MRIVLLHIAVSGSALGYWDPLIPIIKSATASRSKKSSKKSEIFCCTSQRNADIGILDHEMKLFPIVKLMSPFNATESSFYCNSISQNDTASWDNHLYLSLQIIAKA
jgi:hypothetical protein